MKREGTQNNSSPTQKNRSSYSNYSEIEQIGKETSNKIRHFFEHYKELEKGKFVKVIDWKNKTMAEK